MEPGNQTRIIVLLSGGIDSCVALAQALSLNRLCTALSFDYGQRHRIELDSAAAIARHYAVPHLVIRIDSGLFASNTTSALVQHRLPLTKNPGSTPSTYVPCRNLLFLAHAASLAESSGSSEVWIGANADDVPTYPDCSQPFFQAFEKAAMTGSYLGAKGITVVSPLARLTKQAIIILGKGLQAPLDLTWSCYDPKDGKPCTVCPACIQRRL